jgi:hypothetical protein
MKQRKIGAVPPNRIPVIDDQDRLRGHVGKKATAVTASRFLGRLGATLGKKDGRVAWIGPSAPIPRRPETAAHKAARGSVRARGKS